MFLVGPTIIAAQQRINYSLFERTVVLSIDSLVTAYSLPDSFLIKNSERVMLDSTLLVAGRDYEVDSRYGKITFRYHLLAGQKVRVYYRFLPISLKSRYFLRELNQLSSSDQPISYPSQTMVRPRPPAEAAASLTQNGSIVRGISIGSNQGLKLESGLRMEIAGKIANKVEVVAALTDQNTPIQPEGNTQTLQEIDKVFVQLKSDRFQATLGDYYFALDGTEFGPYNRKLQGVMGTADFGKTQLTLSAAVSRGKFTSNYFLGQEGNQGPYQLKGDRGQIDIIVLAGTEKVWVDGQLMTRGEDNDYVIEYSNGQLTFTRRRLITADSRITVDFQFSDQKFQRSLYGANVQSHSKNDKLALNLRLLSEVDNKDNPLDYTLTEENKRRLQLAGDHIDSAVVSGANYLGPGKGSYIAVDSAGVRFYRYVGAEAGDYNVAFEYVGSGQGSYRQLGYANYQYVGPGQGTYLPVIFLSPAQRHDLVDAEITFAPQPNLQLKTELAVSRRDENLFSTRDDRDNSGLALNAQLGLKQQEIQLLGYRWGKVDLSGRYRRVQQDFHFLDRTEEVEKNRKWDLPSQITRAEEMMELQASYFPRDQLRFSAGMGENQRGENFYAQRWEFGSEMTINKLPITRYQIEAINSQEAAATRTSRWIRHQGSSQYQIWKFKPAVQFQAESKKENFQDSLSLGFRYYELSPMLQLQDWKKMAFAISLSQRQQDRLEASIFQPESKASTQTIGWQLQEWRNLSLALEYTHRERTYADSAIGKKLTDLADFRADYAPFRRALTTSWHYQLSNTQVARQERIYIKVERGQGNYRYDEDLNEYVPDVLTGDYILRVRATNDFVPVVELRASSTIKFQPDLLWHQAKPLSSMAQWKKWLTAISTETFVQLEEKTSDPDVWAIYRLNPSHFQNETTTLFGIANLRQDIFWNRNLAKFSVRLRYNQRQDLNNQYLEGGQRSYLVERQMRLKSQLSPKVSSQLDFENRMEQKKYQIAGRSDKDILANQVILDLSYRPRQIFELASKLQWAHAINRVANKLEVNFFSLMPRANYSFRSKGRLRLELELNRVDVRPKKAIVPYEMVGGNRGGTNVRWSAALDYNISRYIRAAFNWNGRYEESSPRPIYTLRAEMRAFF
ncbi:MAG: hypothetical protein ONB11_03665 [candidate division KSB1 bacterium]|nr:hypothetical protein [candidate division KSB1 bacterium]